MHAQVCTRSAWCLCCCASGLQLTCGLTVQLLLLRQQLPGTGQDLAGAQGRVCVRYLPAVHQHGELANHRGTDHSDVEANAKTCDGRLQKRSGSSLHRVLSGWTESRRCPVAGLHSVVVALTRRPAASDSEVHLHGPVAPPAAQFDSIKQVLLLCVAALQVG